MMQNVKELVFPFVMGFVGDDVVVPVVPRVVRGSVKSVDGQTVVQVHGGVDVPQLTVDQVLVVVVGTESVVVKVVEVVNGVVSAVAVDVNDVNTVGLAMSGVPVATA